MKLTTRIETLEALALKLADEAQAIRKELEKDVVKKTKKKYDSTSAIAKRLKTLNSYQ